MKGAVHIDGGQKWRIKPYRHFVRRNFPSKKLKDEYRFEWQPVFREMMKAPGLVIPKDPRDVDDAFVESSYAVATAFLREKYSFIFAGPDGSTENLLIGTWSKKVRRSFVPMHGIPDDIANLPPATARNNKKRAGTVRVSRPYRNKRKCPRRGEGRGTIIRRIEEAAGEQAERDMADPPDIEGEEA